MYGGVESVPSNVFVEAGYHGVKPNSQPNFIRSVSGGDSSSTAFNIATCRWHQRIFAMNATLLGCNSAGRTYHQ